MPVSAFAADSKLGWQTEWERTLRTAEKEGEVTVAIYDQGPVTAAVVDTFQKAFPRIKVNSQRARGSQIGQKSSPNGALKNISSICSPAAKARR